MSWRIPSRPVDAHPPERVLDEVARHLLVVLVEVGQDVDEPARAASRPCVAARGVRVGERPGLPRVREVPLGGAAEPGGRGRVRDPGMVGPGVVGDLVLDDLQSLAVRRVHQLAQRRERAEVLLDAVEVDGAVAVVVGDRLSVVALLLVQVVHVVVPGIEPERGDAQVLQVGQALDDPLEVAAVVVAGARAVEEAPRGRRVVVAGIPVREAVGHDQVDHVVGREALEAPCARERRQDLEGRLVRCRPANAPGGAAGRALRPRRSSRPRTGSSPRAFARTSADADARRPAPRRSRPARRRPRISSRTGLIEWPGHQLGGSTFRTSGAVERRAGGRRAAPGTSARSAAQERRTRSAVETRAGSS